MLTETLKFDGVARKVDVVQIYQQMPQGSGQHQGRGWMSQKLTGLHCKYAEKAPIEEVS